MKKLILFLLSLSLVLSACDKKGCKDTEAPLKSFKISAELTVLNNDTGFIFTDLPVEIIFQKYWCDGSYALQIPYEGKTDFRGVFSAITAFEYELDNELDYILVSYKIGIPENFDSYSDRLFYENINSGVFYIDRTSYY